MRGEFEFINRLRQQSATKRGQSAVRHPPSAIGDDAALFQTRKGFSSIITTDLLVEDVDFRRAWLPPLKLARALGHKSLAVSLSDIAAMGGSARFALTSIGVPEDLWRTKFLDEFYASFHALADAHRTALIGGDISKSECLTIDSIIIGEVKTGCAVQRSGARAGDLVFVTGSLGGAAAGLKLLEKVPSPKPQVPSQFSNQLSVVNNQKQIANRKSQIANSSDSRLFLRLLFPTPRLAVGAWLGEKKLATAMIDISDGLSSDLAHLCRASATGARIYAEQLPLDSSLIRAGFSTDEALNFALHGGEDFELLFTVNPRRVKQIPKQFAGVPITRIGEMTNDRGKLFLITHGRARRLKPRGFTHF
jgi:thiamine-monophosphate kinase